MMCPLTFNVLEVLYSNAFIPKRTAQAASSKTFMLSFTPCPVICGYCCENVYQKLWRGFLNHAMIKMTLELRNHLPSYWHLLCYQSNELKNIKLSQ